MTIGKGVARVTFRAITTLTNEAVPLYIPSVNVTVEHDSLQQMRNDSKPFKDAVGTTNIDEAQTIAEKMLSVAAKDIILQKIMEYLSII